MEASLLVLVPVQLFAIVTSRWTCFELDLITEPVWIVVLVLGVAFACQLEPVAMRVDTVWVFVVRVLDWLRQIEPKVARAAVLCNVGVKVEVERRIANPVRYVSPVNLTLVALKSLLYVSRTPFVLTTPTRGHAVVGVAAGVFRCCFAAVATVGGSWRLGRWSVGRIATTAAASSISWPQTRVRSIVVVGLPLWASWVTRSAVGTVHFVRKAPIVTSNELCTLGGVIMVSYAMLGAIVPWNWKTFSILGLRRRWIISRRCGADAGQTKRKG